MRSLQGRHIDGARRIRTADLLGAIQALCQLSYSPEGEGRGRFRRPRKGKDTRMGFGFPATGGGWVVAVPGEPKPSDAAAITLAFQARVPEKTANRRGSTPIGSYFLALAPLPS